MEIVKKFGRIFECFEGALPESFFQFFAKKNEEEPAAMTLRFTHAPVEYEIGYLAQVVTKTFEEAFALSVNKNYPAQLLKNSNIPGVYSIDSLRFYLEQFSLLKCVIITEKGKLSFCFLDPLNNEAIEKVVCEAGFAVTKESGGYWVCEGKTKILSIKNHAISITLNSDDEHFKLERAIRIFVEMVVRVHQDALIDSSNRWVYLARYAPYLDCAAPTDLCLVGNLREIGTRIISGVFPKEVLSVTKRTASHSFSRQIFKLNKKYCSEHISYVVYIPNDRAFAVRFSIPIDIDNLIKALKDSPFSFGETKKERIDKSGYLKKGGNSRFIKKTITISQKWIQKNGKEVASIEGESIICIPLATLEDALEFFGMIVSRRLLRSGWVETAGFECDLSEFERYVVKNIDDIQKIFNHFVYLPKQKEWGIRVTSGLPTNFDSNKDAEAQLLDAFLAADDGSHNFYAMLKIMLDAMRGDVTDLYENHYMRLPKETRDYSTKLLMRYNEIVAALNVILSGPSL